MIVLRGDGHFSYPEVMEWLDGQDEVKYVLGWAGNARRTKLVQAHVDRATKLYEQTKNEVCLYHIKEHKLYLKSDRTSCTDFSAHQFRLFLHSAAYVLLHALKTNILKHTPWVNATIATSDIHTAAIFGDDAAVRRFLALDTGNATAKGGPRGWDALTHLCFSKYLRLDPGRSDGFVRAATALLDAGASANSGWFEENHQPQPEWEPVLYGAAGVAHHAELTRLLLERGAEPNDGEVVYHVPETYDNAALKVLVESGKLTVGL